MPNWEEIRREWETTKITFRALAEKHGVKEGTLKSRRSREKWARETSKKVASKKVATKKDATPKKQRYPNGHPGNKNPKNQFTKRNQVAVKHGLYAKYLPEETMDIIDGMKERSPIDLLWDQIQIQYAAIIRAQRIMWVSGANDHLDMESGHSSGESGSSTSYKIAYAHERYDAFLSAQSRAMGELRNMIKQYDELLKSEMATEEQKARIEVLKAKVPTKEVDGINDQIEALADLINKPSASRVIDDD